MDNKKIEVLDSKTTEIKIINQEQTEMLTPPAAPPQIENTSFNQKTTNYEEPLPKKTFKISLKQIIGIITCIVLAIILIVIGCYLSYVSNPKQIIKTSINNFALALNDLFKKDEDLDMKDTYTLTSDIKLDLKSNNTINQNTQQLIINNLLKNLSNTNNSLVYKKDKNKKQLYINWATNYNNQELLNTKYLISDSTEYYYVSGFLDKYVNNGTNNYFESLNEETTTKDNITYIYDTILKSLQENLKDDYFEKYQETTSFSSKDEKLTKVSLKLNNERLKKISSGILKDLKNDSKAKGILTNTDKDFFKKKDKDSTKFLEKDENIIFNVYTTNILHKIKKYELIYQNNTEETKITYEQDIDKSQGTMYIIENNKVTYELKITKVNNKYKINILDANSNNQLGKITFEKNNKRTSLLVDFSNNNNQINIDYDLRLSNIVPNKSYDSTMKLSLKIIENNTSILNGSIKATNKITNKVKISEETQTSILESSITEEQRNILNQKLESILNQLTSQKKEQYMSREQKNVKKSPNKTKNKKLIKEKTPKTNSDKVLITVFFLLLILVVILGISVLNAKNKNIDKIKANVIIPVLGTKLNNSLSVDISNMKKTEEKEYIFKIANYRGNKINKENIEYQINLTKPKNVTLKLYKNDNNTNLLSNKETLEIGGIQLERNKKKVDLYRLVIKSNKKTTKDDKIEIIIKS